MHGESHEDSCADLNRQLGPSSIPSGLGPSELLKQMLKVTFCPFSLIRAPVRITGSLIENWKMNPLKNEG